MDTTPQKIPRCIGIIMDGNRRWAREHGLPVLESHRKGYLKMKEVGHWAKDAGVTFLIAYAFSTENWNRTKDEVGYLMDLLRFVLQKELQYFKDNSIRIIVIGNKERLPEDIQEDIARAEDETKQFSSLHVVLAVSYGGRSEIVSAVNKALAKNKEGKMTEESFAEHLFTGDIPDPDIIIRTGGEKRLSNFLPWQSVYSELFFIDTHWPDFSKEEFHAILHEYGMREQRRGK